MSKLDALGRRDIRYWCFRFRTALEPGGASAKGAPKGLRKRFEDMPHFGGWEKFGVTWDVDADDPWRIVPLRFSLEQQWNSEAYANARDLPKTAAQERRDTLVAEHEAQEAMAAAESEA